MSAETVQATLPNAPVKAAWISLAVVWLCFLLPIPGIGLFIGWPLNLVAFIIAIVVMTKGRTTQGLMQLLASLVISPIIYFIGLAIMAAAVTAPAYSEYTEKAQAAQEAMADTESTADEGAITVTARQLFQAYEANEVAADQQYKGKQLAVEGSVSGISKDAFDGIFIELNTGNEFQSVHATGLPEETASQLSKGDRISLACVGDGMLVGSPMLSDCTIVQ